MFGGGSFLHIVVATLGSVSDMVIRSTREWVALLYAFMCGCVIVFQVCLIAGAPWGRITQGGQISGALPTSGRIAAGVSILILLFFAYSVLSRAKLVAAWPSWTAVATLIVYSISMFLNWITPSEPERMLWGPITTIMFALVCASIFAWRQDESTGSRPSAGTPPSRKGQKSTAS